MTGWGGGSSVPSVSTIQSFQIADLGAGFADIIPRFRSLMTLAVSQADFFAPVSASKNSVPRGRVSREDWESWEAKTAVNALTSKATYSSKSATDELPLMIPSLRTFTIRINFGDTGSKNGSILAKYPSEIFSAVSDALDFLCSR
jgi:hypothetical protein